MAVLSWWSDLSGEEFARDRCAARAVTASSPDS